MSERYKPKGCLQSIIHTELIPGTGPRGGFVAHHTLKCGHKVDKFNGVQKGKRAHCIICLKERENENK
jgi:hypothetical protein